MYCPTILTFFLQYLINSEYLNRVIYYVDIDDSPVILSTYGVNHERRMLGKIVTDDRDIP
jgi:hypothetical protein